MINLMSPTHSANLRYRHTNTILRRWLITSTLAIGGLILIVVVGWLYIANQNRDLTNSINLTKTQLQAQNLSEVQKQATTLTGNIKTINQVMSREIHFSDLIQQIGTVMPSGTVLSSLSLGSVNGAIDLSVNSKDYTSAAQLAINLGDPKNNIFQKVDIVNINCSSTSVNVYPCSGTYKALFGSSAKNRFLNVPSGVKQ